MPISKAEFNRFKKGTDKWIKKHEGDISDLKPLESIVKENIGNIQHNYELILELKEDVNFLKKTLTTLMDSINNLTNSQNTIKYYTAQIVTDLKTIKKKNV